MDFRWPPAPSGRPERARTPARRGPQTGRPTLPLPATDLIETPHGVQLESLVTGGGNPVTVFAHGFAGGIEDTRPLGSAVAGRRVFFHFRGHGRSSAPPGQWDYADLARDLRAVSDLYAATRAVATSMGAGALFRLIADDPTRFDRAVLFLPAALDQPGTERARQRLVALFEAVRANDAAAVAEAITSEVPPQLRDTPAGWAYFRQRIEQLLRDGLADGLAGMPARTPLDDASVLADVSTATLVIGCLGDDAHPVEVAERLAGLLPNARLHVYSQPRPLWTERDDVRERIAGFLNSGP